MVEHDFDYTAVEKRLGVSRREFLKFCAGVAASLGLSTNAALAMAQAVADPKRRPPVIWLHGQECTGPSEALLRSEQPSLEHLPVERFVPPEEFAAMAAEAEALGFAGVAAGPFVRSSYQAESLYRRARRTRG